MRADREALLALQMRQRLGDVVNGLPGVRRLRKRLHDIILVLHRLDTRTAQVTQQMAQVVSALEEMGSSGDNNVAVGHNISRLEAMQTLTARTYEAIFDWPGKVEAMRRESGYEEAWHGEPLISVRIATYNNAEVLVDRALASVLRQTYTNWEAIVVGDACTDDTERLIAAIGDDRIHFENLPVRGPYPTDATSLWHTAGIPPANRALELARGRWIAPLDHDDEFDDDHLEVLLAEAQRTHAELVYGKWRMVDAENGRLFDHAFGGEYPPVSGAIAFQAALYHGKLTRFRYDMNTYLVGEPGDRNLARRLWEAGVRFAVLDRVVVTYWFEPRSPWGREWLATCRARFNYVNDR
jgi:hypothetical protein